MYAIPQGIILFITMMNDLHFAVTCMYGHCIRTLQLCVLQQVRDNMRASVLNTPLQPHIGKLYVPVFHSTLEYFYFNTHGK